MMSPYRIPAPTPPIVKPKPKQDRKRLGYLLYTLSATIWAAGLLGCYILRPLARQIGLVSYMICWVGGYYIAGMIGMWLLAPYVREELD